MNIILNLFKTSTYIFVLLFVCNLNAQLVNIESKRMHTDSLRFVLHGDLLFNYTDNNGNYILQIGSNVSAQVKSKNLKRIFFLVGNMKLIRSKNEDFQNSYFLHARYNQKLSKVMRLEAFVQNQNNKNLTITERNLLGLGLRAKLVSTNRTQAYIGNSFMYEQEKIGVTNQKFYNHRNSSYFSLNHNFPQFSLDITGTLYFQPLYRNISNHRILSQFKAQIPLNKRVSFSALYNYAVINFDSSLYDDRFSNISFGFTLNM